MDAIAKAPAKSDVKEFNKLARQAAESAHSAVVCAHKAGMLAKDAKDLVPHGEWTDWINEHYDVTPSTVRRWVRFYEQVPEDQLEAVSSVNAGLKVLELKEAADKDDRKDSASGQENTPEASRNDTEDLGGTDNEEGEDVFDIDDEEDVFDIDDELEEDETLADLCEREAVEIEKWAKAFGIQLKTAQERFSDFPTLDHLNIRTGWERKFAEALETLRGAKPVICPLCDGDNPKCLCKGAGRVTRQQKTQMV